MKPFDLERALAGDPVVTRDGRPVTQLTLFESNPPLTFCLYGVAGGTLINWRKTGIANCEEYFEDDEYTKDSMSDLFMAPREVWIIVLEHPVKDMISTYGTTFNTKEEADEQVNAITKLDCNSFNKIYIRSITLED